jgi:hypothetical protein
VIRPIRDPDNLDYAVITIVRERFPATTLLLVVFCHQNLKTIGAYICPQDHRTHCSLHCRSPYQMCHSPGLWQLRVHKFKTRTHHTFTPPPPLSIGFIPSGGLPFPSVPSFHFSLFPHIPTRVHGCALAFFLSVFCEYIDYIVLSFTPQSLSSRPCVSLSTLLSSFLRLRISS